MSVSDVLGDMLARIQNGQARGKEKILCPSSSLRKRVLDVMKRHGFIRGYVEVMHRGAPQPELEIEPKYYEGRGVIQTIERVSKPGRRVYAGSNDIGRVSNGLGIYIVSTPRGVMSDNEARAQNVGGEILCRIF